MKELFKNGYYTTGFIIGILFIIGIVIDIIQTGFHPVFIFVYALLFIILVVTATDNTEDSFNLFLGIGIPYVLIILLIFNIVDRKNKRKTKLK